MQKLECCQISIFMIFKSTRWDNFTERSGYRSSPSKMCFSFTKKPGNWNVINQCLRYSNPPICLYIYIATTLSANTANLSVPSIHGFPHSKWGPFSQNKEASLAILIYTSYISSFTYTHTLNPSINQPAENWDIAQSLPNSSYVVNDGACKTRGCRSRVRLGGDKWIATIIGKTGPLDWVCHSNHGVWPIYLHELLKLLGYMIYM